MGILGQPRIRNGLRKGDFGSATWRQREAGSEMGVLGSARGKTGTESIVLGASFWERHAAPAQIGLRKQLFGAGAKKRRRKRTQKAAFGVGLTSPAHTELTKRGSGPA